MIELTRDQISNLALKDQAAVYDAEMTEVDNIRLLKTNKQFYDKVFCLWLRFLYVQTAESLAIKS